MNLEKTRIRKRHQALRGGLPASVRKASAKKIASRLQGLAVFKSAKTVGIYLSVRSEVDTLSLLKILRRLGKTAAAPRAVPRSRGLQFHAIPNGLEDCRTGSYGIPEPLPSCRRVPDEKIDLLLVPGLAFDVRGIRLGYGKGYYDRYLEKHPRIPALGLAYEKNFTLRLPRDARDRPVHRVLTEKHAYWTGEPVR